MRKRTDVRGPRWMAVAAVVAVLAVLAACTSDGDGDGDEAGGPEATVPADERATEDTARYVLPPGNYGGIPTNDDSLDQLPLYDGLTPRRGDVTDAVIEEQFIPMDFEPVGTTTVEDTGRPGLELVYDEFGVAHITGETREDVAFGAGWVAARDRTLLIQLALGPARAAVADVPGIDAFSLVTSGQTFVPSEEAEALVTEQWDLLLETYPEDGAELRADAEAGAEGANAYFESQGIDTVVTPNDVLAATAFIGSIFGAGGGGEVENADLLAQLQTGLGEARGTDAWNDAMFSDDPEAPTTIDREFDYPALTGGEVTGSVPIDAGSVVPLDAVPGGPPDPTDDGGGAGAGAGAGSEPAEPGVVDPTDAPPDREASNWLVVNPERSATGSTQAVMGPQLGYYYPEIVQQIHVKGPDFEAQGAAVPGLNMYILIGRTADYAWSLTSAGHDVRDVYAEELCEPDGSAPTADSDHYLFEGECRPMEVFDAGTLNGNPVTYPTTVHGPVIGTATSDGQPVALTRKRSTFGRDGLNIVALKNMTEGEASTPEDFFEVANRFEFTFNWGYASRTDTAFFSSGRLPVRPEGLDRRLPTSGTGDYEWEGFLELDQHPHDTVGPDGLLLNWNNQAAPNFMHGDGVGDGPYQRVELFDDWPEATQLTDVVGIMNRSATEDVRSVVWRWISEVLHEGQAPSDRDAQVLALLDEWVDDDAPRLDADDDGTFDSAGPTILDALWLPLVRAALEPVYGEQLDALDAVRPLQQIGMSFLDKDLRTLLGEDVDDPLALQYCGGGDLDACSASLWSVVEEQANALADQYGPEPADWRGEADRTEFIPGLIPETMRRTNRPTYQQVLELANR